MHSKGLFIRFEVIPEREHKVSAFMASLFTLVQHTEHQAWFAFRARGDKYGIFMVTDFEQALASPIHEAVLHQAGKLYTGAAEVTIVDILEHKLPAKQTEEDTKGILLTFKAKEEHEQQVEEFLIKAKAFADRENDTTSWFAFRLPHGAYGIFDSFPGNGGRIQHLFGRIPRELGKHAFTLLGSFPDITLLDILEEHVEQSKLHLTTSTQKNQPLKL